MSSSTILFIYLFNLFRFVFTFHSLDIHIYGVLFCESGSLELIVSAGTSLVSLILLLSMLTSRSMFVV